MKNISSGLRVPPSVQNLPSRMGLGVAIYFFMRPFPLELTAGKKGGQHAVSCAIKLPAGQLLMTGGTGGAQSGSSL